MENTVHPAFELLRSADIPNLNLTVEEYRHRNTGAQHIHLAADNEENVFVVALRTVPEDSTGVAHILEHTALCGSEHYPVRDPFFMMIRRSLNTFMNAFTSSDWTAYPFASQNRKDFNNLLDVYLDAVFFSRLDPLDFAQEGHRVEFAEADNPDSELVFKGVVFNEMKGAMSSPASTLWQTLSAELFPTTTYHYNSGGDPAHIPDLDYEQLLAFYRSHYHPSNAVFMTFGNIPAREHHTRFEKRALSRFTALAGEIGVGDERRYSEPRQAEARYALDDSDKVDDKTHIVMGWLLGRSTELESLLHANLMSSVLLDNSASPLRHMLETCGLGSAPSPLCGLEDSNREMSFMCGIEGSRPERAEALEQEVLRVLHDVAENGVPQEQLEAALHQLELSQREITGDGFPYGLHLIISALSAAIHRGDPIAALNVDPILEQLREEIRDPDFIKRLVRSQLLDNPHRVRLTMKPDTGLSQEQAQREKQRLAAIRDGLSDADKQHIIEQTRRLMERQQQQDDPEILPKVGREDIPAELQVAQRSPCDSALPLTCYAQGTNGLAYQQIILDLPALDTQQMEDLSHLSRIMTEVGCDGRSYLETQAWQDRISGGVSTFSMVRGRVDDEQQVRGYFVASGKALTRNHGDLSELMQATLLRPRFDEYPRLRELVAQSRARREQSVTGQGHSLAMMAASSGLSPTAALGHRMRGLAGIRALKQLDDRLDDAPAMEDFTARLAALHERLLDTSRQFLLIADQEHLAGLCRDLEQIWTGPQARDQAAFTLPPTRTAVRQMWVTSTQVNFCARAYPVVPVEHPDAAALIILGGFLRNGFLHRAIREQGGAYGGGAGYDSDSASFRFYSYRDPRLTDTLADFDRSIDWLLSERHQQSQLEEALLGVIGSMDKPGSPAGEAKDAFHNALFGRSREQRQRFRERVLAVTLDDLKRVAETWLQGEAATAVITSQATLDAGGDLGLDVIPL